MAAEAIRRRRCGAGLSGIERVRAVGTPARLREADRASTGQKERRDARRDYERGEVEPAAVARRESAAKPHHRSTADAAANTSIAAFENLIRTFFRELHYT